MVSTGTVQILERFGKFTQVAKPGCHLLNPLMCDCVAATLSMRLQQLDLTCETKTKDNVFLALRVALQFQVEDSDLAVQAAHYRLTAPRKQIESRLFDAIRSAVPRLTLDELFGTKEQLSADVEKAIQAQMIGLGYAIVKTMITDIEVDPGVKAAMNRINFMARRKDAAYDEAEADKVRAVLTAEAFAAATEIRAKANAAAKHLDGIGAARQRHEILGGMSTSISGFEEGVEGADTKGIMDLFTITEHFDMMKEVGAKEGTRLLLDPSPAAVAGVTKAVADGFIPGLPTGAPSVNVMSRPARGGGGGGAGAAAAAKVGGVAAGPAQAAAAMMSQASSGIMSLFGVQSAEQTASSSRPGSGGSRPPSADARGAAAPAPPPAAAAALTGSGFDAGTVLAPASGSRPVSSSGSASGASGSGIVLKEVSSDPRLDA